MLRREGNPASGVKGNPDAPRGEFSESDMIFLINALPPLARSRGARVAGNSLPTWRNLPGGRACVASAGLYKTESRG
jgi:hypothetical protein